MSLNDHLSRPAVTNRFKRPTRERDGQPHDSLCGLASSGVYRACPVTRTAVSSYLAFPPLLAASFISKRERRNCKRYISVALSLGSPPPGVTRHPALWSPDFPHSKLRGRSAASSEGKYNTCSTSRQLEDRVI